MYNGTDGKRGRKNTKNLGLQVDEKLSFMCYI